MNNIKLDERISGKISIIKNLKNKYSVRCVYKGIGTDT
jgi:hypothetical protein